MRRDQSLKVIEIPPDSFRSVMWKFKHWLHIQTRLTCLSSTNSHSVSIRTVYNLWHLNLWQDATGRRRRHRGCHNLRRLSSERGVCQHSRYPPSQLSYSPSDFQINRRWSCWISRGTVGGSEVQNNHNIFYETQQTDCLDRWDTWFRTEAHSCGWWS